MNEFFVGNERGGGRTNGREYPPTILITDGGAIFFHSSMNNCNRPPTFDRGGEGPATSKVSGGETETLSIVTKGGGSHFDFFPPLPPRKFPDDEGFFESRDEEEAEVDLEVEEEEEEMFVDERNFCVDFPRNLLLGGLAVDFFSAFC